MMNFMTIREKQKHENGSHCLRCVGNEGGNEACRKETMKKKFQKCNKKHEKKHNGWTLECVQVAGRGLHGGSQVEMGFAAGHTCVVSRDLSNQKFEYHLGLKNRSS